MLERADCLSFKILILSYINLQVGEDIFQENLSTGRYSRDSGKNITFGYRLISLCKSVGLCTANGRCGYDVLEGKNTCDDKSLMDDLLLSPRNFIVLQDFHIHDFDPIFSDKHCLYH